MPDRKNILFIMADQLRSDYLACNGHPTIKTPNIDALAATGVNFTNAFCQSAVCGPSMMSFYTGRYMFTHGGTWNNIPIRVDEKTMGIIYAHAVTAWALWGKHILSLILPE